MGFDPPQPISYDVPCFKFFTNCLPALRPSTNSHRVGDGDTESVEYLLYFYIIIWNISNAAEENLRSPYFRFKFGGYKNNSPSKYCCLYRYLPLFFEWHHLLSHRDKFLMKNFRVNRFYFTEKNFTADFLGFINLIGTN